jgi:hypothetical protein
MISPRERYEREEFWELAEDIASTDIDTGSVHDQDNRTFTSVFRKLKLKSD